MLVSRYFNNRCALPRLYPKSMDVLPSALFSAHHLLMFSRTSSWGVHLNAGSPKVHSVIKVSHFIGSYGVEIPSFSVL